MGMAMDAYNKFTNLMQLGEKGQSDIYSDIMSKENNVLDLIRRVDDTERERRLSENDNLVPMVQSFIVGISSFIARASHYASAGNTTLLMGMLSSAEGLIYMGVLLMVVSVVVSIF